MFNQRVTDNRVEWELSAFNKITFLSFSPGYRAVVNALLWGGGAILCGKRKKNFFGGGQILNCKFKTFGFLDFRHKYKYYFISPSNKTSRKNSKLFFLCLFEKCESLEF